MQYCLTAAILIIAITASPAQAGLERLSFEADIAPVSGPASMLDQRVPQGHISGSFVFEYDANEALFKDRPVVSASLTIAGYRYNALSILVSHSDSENGYPEPNRFFIGSDVNLDPNYPNWGEHGSDTSREVTLYLPRFPDIGPTPNDFVFYCENGDFSRCRIVYTTEGYVNFYSNSGFSDNRQPLPLSVTVTAAIPEPTTWTMTIAGFALVGLAARRRYREFAD